MSDPTDSNPTSVFISSKLSILSGVWPALRSTRACRIAKAAVDSRVSGYAASPKPIALSRSVDNNGVMPPSSMFAMRLPVTSSQNRCISCSLRGASRNSTSAPSSEKAFKHQSASSRAASTPCLVPVPIARPCAPRSPDQRSDCGHQQLPESWRSPNRDPQRLTRRCDRSVWGPPDPPA